MSGNEKGKEKDGVWEAFKDRFNGPVTGPFLIVWLIFNWQVVVLLVYENGDAFQRVSSISALDWRLWQNAWQVWLGPLLCTAAYLIFVPQIRRLYFLYLLKVDTTRRLAQEHEDFVVRYMGDYGRSLTVLLGALKRETNSLRTIATSTIAMIDKGLGAGGNIVSVPLNNYDQIKQHIVLVQTGLGTILDRGLNEFDDQQVDISTAGIHAWGKLRLSSYLRKRSFFRFMLGERIDRRTLNLKAEVNVNSEGKSGGG